MCVSSPVFLKLGCASETSVKWYKIMYPDPSPVRVENHWCSHTGLIIVPRKINVLLYFYGFVFAVPLYFEFHLFLFLPSPLLEKFLVFFQGLGEMTSLLWCFLDSLPFRTSLLLSFLLTFYTFYICYSNLLIMCTYSHLFPEQVMNSLFIALSAYSKWVMVDTQCLLGHLSNNSHWSYSSASG